MSYQIKRAGITDFLDVAALDRTAWPPGPLGAYLPDGEHAWRVWVEYAVVGVARQADAAVGLVLLFPSLDASR